MIQRSEWMLWLLSKKALFTINFKTIWKNDMNFKQNSTIYDIFQGTLNVYFKEIGMNVMSFKQNCTIYNTFQGTLYEYYDFYTK